MNSRSNRFRNGERRKPTTKKNKIWDGDGLLSIRNGLAKLQDLSGKDMGRIGYANPLLPGSTLAIGGKDVEIDSIISRDEYLERLSSKETQKTQPNQPTERIIQETKTIPSIKPQPVIQPPPHKMSNNQPPKSLDQEHSRQTERGRMKAPNSVAIKSAATSTAFRNPLKGSTVMPQHPGSRPTPRHDPTVKGAIVMERPKIIPRGLEVVDVVLDPELSRKLRDHQVEGVKFLYECVMGIRDFGGEGAILADEMGLGKSLQTITLLWTLLKQNPFYHDPPKPVVKKALIVCPVTLIDNWRKEFRKWLGNERIGVFIADGKKTRLTDFTMGKAYSVMIIGYERLRTVAEDLARGSGIDIIIADEGHRLKTMQNKSAQAIQSLNTPRRIILSGTPIQNDLSEFFCMVNFVNDGILGSYKSFLKGFETPILKSRQPNAIQEDVENGEMMSEELASLTSPFILRRTADVLEKFLPPKTEYVVFCNPTPTQAAIYRNVLASPLFQFALGNGSESALQLITILKKLCNSPSLLNPKPGEASNSGASNSLRDLLSSLSPTLIRTLTNASSAKIRILDSLLMTLRTRTNEKIILVSNYTSTLDVLQSLLASLSLTFLRLDGSTPAGKRQGLVDDFNRPHSNVFAFLLSAKAGGLGLNLIGASRLVLFDVDWNPATDVQAMARVHREGQKREVKIYRFVMKGTVEERIWMRQVEKGGLASSVLELGGNVASSSAGGKKGAFAQFSREELKDLFRFEEDRELKTHELIRCPCKGQGVIASSHGEKKYDEGDISSHNRHDKPTSPDAAKHIPQLAKAAPSSNPRKRRRRHLQILDSESESASDSDHEFSTEAESDTNTNTNVSDEESLPSPHSLLHRPKPSAPNVHASGQDRPTTTTTTTTSSSSSSSSRHPLQARPNPTPSLLRSSATSAASATTTSGGGAVGMKASSLLSSTHYAHFNTSLLGASGGKLGGGWEGEELGDDVLWNVIQEQQQGGTDGADTGMNLVGWVFRKKTREKVGVEIEG